MRLMYERGVKHVIKEEIEHNGVSSDGCKKVEGHNAYASTN